MAPGPGGGEGGSLPEALLQAVVLCALVSVPLFFNPQTERVFEPDKIAWLLALGAIGLWAQLLRLLARGREAQVTAARLRQLGEWSPIVVAAALTLLVTVVATAASLSPTVSLWGQYRRGQGLLALVGYASVFWAVMVAMRDDARAAARIQRAIVVVTIPMSLYALLQRLGVDSLIWQATFEAASRAFSSLGNPIFLGAFLVMAVPMLVSRGIAAWHEARSGSRGGAWALLGVSVALALAVSALLATQSRGPLLGFLAGGLVFAVVWLAATQRTRAAAAIAGCGAIAVLSLLLVGRIGGASVGRLGEVAWSGSRTAQERLLAWDALAAAARSSDGRMWLGYGPDTAALLIAPHADQDLARLAPDQVFDRAHNAAWEAWVAGGAAGVAAWLALYVVAYTVGLRCLRLADTRRDAALLAGTMLVGAAAGGVAGYVARPSAWAAGLPLGLLVGLLLAGLLGAARQRPDDAGVDRARKIEAAFVAALLAAVSAHLVETTVGLPTAASEMLFWVCLGALAAVDLRRRSGRAGSEARVGSGRQSRKDAQSVPEGWPDGIVDGLALSTVVISPVLISNVPNAPTRPGLWLLPLSVWLVGDLVATGPARPPWSRAAARLALLVLTVVLLYAGAGRSGTVAVTYLILILTALAALAWSLTAGKARPKGVTAGQAVVVATSGIVTALIVWRAALAPVLADGMIRSGLEAVARGDVGAAGRAFDRATALWPEQTAYAVYRAAVLRERLVGGGGDDASRDGAYDEALAILQRADERVPDAATALALATLMRERGDVEVQTTARLDFWSQAIRQVAQARSRSPWSTEALLEQGALEERLGYAGTSRGTYAVVADLRPELAAGWLGLARAALAEGDLDAAEAALRQGIDVTDTGPMAQQARAIGADRLSLAARLADPRLALPAAHSAVMALALSGDRTAAVDLLQSVADAYPDDAITEALRAWIARLGS